jgi:hypothetical protein
MTQQFKYTLRAGSKKDLCPQCNKKTYVPFIESESGDEINAGRCDREQHCGYFKKPESNDFTIAPKFEAMEIKTDYISLEVLDKYFNLKNTSNLNKWLLSKFEKDLVRDAEYDYFLCAKGESVIFWQIDQLSRTRSGKVMDYNPTTGKRTKDAFGKSNISWMHKQPYNLKQCLFGLHLMNEYKDKPIGIVESEKTAVIMSIAEPRLLWMACGSMSGFKLDYLAPLRLRKIIAFPDKGCFDKWQEVAVTLSDMGFDITVNDVLENNINANLGDDIADHVL